MPDSNKQSSKPSTLNLKSSVNKQLFDIFDHLIPLVDNISDGIRAIALLGIVISTWLFIWSFFILHTSLTTTLIISAVSFLPSLILLRYWWALEAVKELPDIAEEMLDDVTSEVKSTWKEVSNDRKKALNFIGQAKNIWEMKSLLGQLDDMFNQYLNIGVLINPLSILVAIISLLSVLVLLLIAFATVLTSIF